MGLPQSSDRLVYLDALRGLSALAIAIFWHYQTLGAPTQTNAPIFTDGPLYTAPIVGLLYRYGYVAVDFFFLISGLVFHHVYERQIAAGVVSARRFFGWRFSRLYPLHFLTLCVTAILVWTYHGLTGRFPIPTYPWNDAYHFLLNLLFLQKGFFDRGFSFNSPTWSLSVEAFLYAWFFIAARRRVADWTVFLFVLIGLAIWISGRRDMFILNGEISRGIVGFFVGMLIGRLTERPDCARIVMFAYPMAWLLFGTLLVALQTWPRLQRLLAFRPLALLGELSLAVYLVNMPLQMILVLTWQLADARLPIDSWAFLLGYIGAVLVLAWLLHFAFERPVRMWLRQVLSRGENGAGPAGALSP